MKTKIILGPPGTGKTHNLLELVEEELARGTPPDRIAFVAFTKKAANEARNRAMKKFKLEEQHLPYFRTLHSFAFHQLGMTKSEVMSRDNYKEFAQAFGMDLRSVTDGKESGGIVTTDNILINEVNLARMKCMELEHHYNSSNLQDVSWHALLRAQRALEEFKKKKELLDFTDMIEMYLDSGMIPKLDVVFVDEAQDLCRLQWRMVDKISQNSNKIFISGDDDQAIYRWAGADVEHLINMPGETKVLTQSYRCPRVVQNFSQRIIGRVRNRRPKSWRGTNKEGFLQFHSYPESVDLKSEGTWLVMARTQYLLDEIERDVRLQGLLYKRNNELPVSQKLLNAVNAWKRLNEGEYIELPEVKSIYSYMSTEVGIERGFKHLKTAAKEKYEMEELVMQHGLLVAGRPWDVAFDKVGNRDREFLRAVESRNNSGDTEARINLSTIHGAKGGEADNVMLLTDLPRKAQEAMEVNADDETRVFYVGATRARDTLHIVQPQRYGGFII
jgi:DNA helicase-2/ATP-dependent DNA helicase PcrA